MRETTIAVTTLATVRQGVPPCEHCQADVMGTQIGFGIFLCEIGHEPGCPKVLPTYEKPST
jgi:hypothetical protein